MKRLASSLSLVAAVCSVSFAQIGNDSFITPERLRAHLEFVANDLLEGRDTPSRGLDLACWYVATQLKLWGVKPAGENGTYFQTLKFSKPEISVEKSSMNFNGVALSWGKDFAINPIGGAVTDSNLVFVGYGWKIPSKNLDPYAKVNVKGKLMVVMSGMPPGTSRRDRNTEKFKDALSPEQAATEFGATGIIQLPSVAATTDFAGYAKRFVSASRATMGGASSNLPTVTLSADMAKTLFAEETVNGDAVLKANEDRTMLDSFELKPDKKINFTLSVNGNETTAFNVVGIVEGSDPKLKSEYVAIGAHIDHVGMGGNGPDKIFNGADDDGSGTVSILEIAHAFATGTKPKRSVIFVWHCGEEKGLWGSNHFVENPSVPLGNIVAQLNIDMIGRSRPAGDTNPANKMLTDANSIYVVGSRKISSELGDINEQSNKKLFNLKFDYHYDEPNDPENIYQRSDHYNYARKGIPIAFFFDGVHEDYHRVTDHADKIDYVKMSKVARTVYGTAFLLGNLDHRPKVNAGG